MTKENTNPVVKKLENGTTFICDTSFQGQAVSVAALIQTGARDERDNEHGISHFLEHMVFKGTERRSAMDLTLAFGDLGAQVNAYTSDEQTVLYGTVLNSNADTLHDILTDMLQPALVQDDFDVEKKVILEEIALYQDRPHYMLYEQATNDFFGGEGVGQSVLGTTDSVSAITSEEMKAYVDRRYRGPNIVISVCGNIDVDAFTELSEERTKKLSSDEEGSSPVVNPSTSRSSQRFAHKNITQAHLLGLAPGPSATDELRYAGLLCSVICGDAQNSRLYWELVDTGIAEYATLDHEDKDGVGVWMLNASTTPESIEQVKEKSLAVLKAVQSNMSEAELERAKTKALSRLVMDSELPLGKAMANALSFQYRGEPFRLKEEMARIRAVSLKDCFTLMEKYPLTDLSLYEMLAC